MNWVADCLSCYYETDGLEDKHPDHEFVPTDTWLDLDGELLPVWRYIYQKYMLLPPANLIAWLKTLNNVCSRAIR